MTVRQFVLPSVSLSSCLFGGGQKRLKRPNTLALQYTHKLNRLQIGFSKLDLALLDFLLTGYPLDKL